MKPSRGLMSSFLFLTMLTSLGFTQQSQSDDKSDDISELRGQVTALAKQQQEILDRLNELKQLITASVSRPGPQLPAPSAIASKNENFRGASNATIAIIEYADFECPFCGEYEHDTYPQISKDYIQTGKVKYFFCDLPLSVHPHAMGAARAARCAGEQGKFWEMHDSLYAKQNALRDVDMPDRALELGLDKTKFSECLVSDRYTNEIKQSMAEAQKMGIAGTPMFFIGKIEANGQLTNMKPIIGARPYETFKAAIDALLGATN